MLWGVDLLFLPFDIGDIAAAMTDDVLFCNPLVIVDMKDDDDDDDAVDTDAVAAWLDGEVGVTDMALRSISVVHVYSNRCDEMFCYFAVFISVLLNYFLFIVKGEMYDCCDCDCSKPEYK